MSAIPSSIIEEVLFDAWAAKMLLEEGYRPHSTRIGDMEFTCPSKEDEEGNRTYVIGCDTVSTPEGFKTTFKVASEKVFASFCKRMKDQADAAKTTQKTDEQQQHDAADETKGTQDDTEPPVKPKA